MNENNQSIDKAAVKAALETLTERERQVLEQRFGFIDGYTRTVEEVARQFKVTREYIIEIENKALKKITAHQLNSKLACETTIKTPADVRTWSASYPVEYDALNYDPYIEKARAGDVDALRRVTEWKNPGQGNPPTAMRLSAMKEVAFGRFLNGLPRYLEPGGSNALRDDFQDSSPVYAIFWHHVLFGTPIFDVHTNRAFTYFTTGKLLKGRDAAVKSGKHWRSYDCYCEWFATTLDNLQKQDSTITGRDLDRALMQWGIAHK